MAGFLAGSGPPAYAANDALLELMKILRDKGSITQEEYALLVDAARTEEDKLETIKQEVTAEVKKDVAMQAADLGGAPAVKPGEVPKDAGVKVGAGNLKLGGLMQVWFMHDPTTAFGAKADAESTYRLRRGEIVFNGDIMPDIGFHIMFDPAKLLSVNQQTSAGAVTNVSVNQNSAVLQDLDVRLRLAKMFPEIAGFAPNLEVIVGQQKTPVTEEGYRSSARLDLVERTQIGRIYGDRRSTGVLVKNSHEYVDYYVGVFNDGFLLNDVDNNDAKTLAGHLVLKPLPEWKVGVFGQVSDTGSADADQDRWGFDSQWEPGNGRFAFKAEYLHAADGAVDSQGFYLQPAYYLIPEKLQLAGRYDWLDPNGDIGDNEIEEISAGLNWYFYQYNAKLQLQYLHRNNEAPPAGVAEHENVLLMNLQTAF
jgi:hypothetical protein